MFCYCAASGIIFGEDDYVLELVTEMFVRSMRLNELTYVDLIPSQYTAAEGRQMEEVQIEMELFKEGENTGTPSLADNSAVRSPSSFPPPFVSKIYGIFLCCRTVSALCAAGIGSFPSIRTPSISNAKA